ncbi:MAG: permease-like cell division protein FtsX [Clostridia bacterium]|nr:permease-like cell division protein FtsX [Clostridia bacterium]
MKFRFYNVGYFFRLAFQGIFRNSIMSLTTVFVLISTLIVMGSTWALTTNIEYNLQEINTYNKIVVFITRETEDHTTSLLREKIQRLPSVESVEWVTKDEVLKDLAANYGDYGDILQMYDDDNPCKDELIITYTDSSRVTDLTYQINAMNEEEETFGVVDKINDRREVAEKIDSVKNVVVLVCTWLMALLFVVSVFIIMNTIKLAVFSRREEVSIMRYVGASGFFVAFPFVLEGIILGAFSSLTSFGIMYYGYQLLSKAIGDSGLITVLPFSSMLREYVIFFAGVGIGLGVIGSLLSLRKYNRD